MPWNLHDGGAANDTLNGDSGTDFVLFGGSAAVVVDLSLANNTAKRGSETDKLISIEGAIGSSAGDSFKGDDDANWSRAATARTPKGAWGRDPGRRERSEALPRAPSAGCGRLCRLWRVALPSTAAII